MNLEETCIQTCRKLQQRYKKLDDKVHEEIDGRLRWKRPNPVGRSQLADSYGIYSGIVAVAYVGITGSTLKVVPAIVLNILTLQETMNKGYSRQGTYTGTAPTKLDKATRLPVLAIAVSAALVSTARIINGAIDKDLNQVYRGIETIMFGTPYFFTALGSYCRDIRRDQD